MRKKQMASIGRSVDTGNVEVLVVNAAHCHNSFICAKSAGVIDAAKSNDFRMCGHNVFCCFVCHLGRVAIDLRCAFRIISELQECSNLSKLACEL